MSSIYEKPSSETLYSFNTTLLSGVFISKTSGVFVLVPEKTSQWLLHFCSCIVWDNGHTSLLRNGTTLVFVLPAHEKVTETTAKSQSKDLLLLSSQGCRVKQRLKGNDGGLVELRKKPPAVCWSRNKKKVKYFTHNLLNPQFTAGCLQVSPPTKCVLNWKSTWSFFSLRSLLAKV